MVPGYNMACYTEMANFGLYTEMDNIGLVCPNSLNYVGKQIKTTALANTRQSALIILKISF